MIWLFVCLGVLAMGAVALVAAGYGAPMVTEFDDRRDVLVPPVGEVTSHDLRAARFQISFRGYRMSEVDALLDRLASQLEAAEGDAAWQRDDVDGEGRAGEDFSPEPSQDTSSEKTDVPD